MIYGLGRGDEIVVLRLDPDLAGELLAAAVGPGAPAAGAHTLPEAVLLDVAERAGEHSWRWLAGEIEFVAFAPSAAVPHDADPRLGALVRAALAGRVEEPGGTTVLWRPVGPRELALIEASGWSAFPPRLPDQPIFYPVLNRGYAERIAREWNVPASGAGAVTEFRVATAVARRYPTRRAGGTGIEELWVPAEELDAFNAAIRGPISVVTTVP